jgi:hypothetical protein
MESRLAQLAQVRDLGQLVGASVHVGQYDSIIKTSQTDDTVVILIRRPKFREYRYQTCFDGASLILLSWTLEAGRWTAQDPITVPDTDYQPHRLQNIGEVRTLGDKIASDDWAVLCHKPGMKTRFGQRDSYERSFDGYRTEPSVKDQWSTLRPTSSQSDAY